jgi:hypothetical protein
MMSLLRLALLLTAALALAACGEPREPRPLEETVLKDQVRAMEKARAVEDQADERKRELDRQLERDTGGDQ